MAHEDLIVYGSLLVVAVLAILVISLSIRARRRYEQQAAALTASDIRSLSGSLLADKAFLWGVWEDTLALRQDQLRVRDQDGRDITCIVRHTVALDGVRREFDWEGQRLQLVGEGGWSSRTVLRESGSGRILLSCRRRRLQSYYFAGDDKRERCRIPYTTVFHRYWSIRCDGKEIGRFFLLPQVAYYVPVIAVRYPALTPLEQVFILISQ